MTQEMPPLLKYRLGRIIMILLVLAVVGGDLWDLFGYKWQYPEQLGTASVVDMAVTSKGHTQYGTEYFRVSATVEYNGATYAGVPIMPCASSMLKNELTSMKEVLVGRPPIQIMSTTTAPTNATQIAVIYNKSTSQKNAAYEWLVLCVGILAFLVFSLVKSFV